MDSNTINISIIEAYMSETLGGVALSGISNSATVKRKVQVGLFGNINKYKHE